MSAARAETELVALGLQPLALDAKRSAAYVGLSPRCFLEAVDSGLYPKPMPGPGRKRWNRIALEAAHGLSRSGGDAIMGQIDEARSQLRGQGTGLSLFPPRKDKGSAARRARQP